MLNKINSPLNFRPLRVRQVEDFAKFAIFNSRSQLTHRFLHKITRDGSEIRRFYFGLTWIFYAPSCVANGWTRKSEREVDSRCHNMAWRQGCMWQLRVTARCCGLRLTAHFSIVLRDLNIKIIFLILMDYNIYKCNNGLKSFKTYCVFHENIYHHLLHRTY